MSQALNEHMNKEMYSAYLYMSMSAFSDSIGLKGFARWFMAQYHEEMFHAMKVFEYLRAQGGRIELLEIAQPPSCWESPLDLFEKTLDHERMVTQRINELMDLAFEEKDHATGIFLQWYVTEQVEEEENDNEILDQLRLIKDSPQGLLMLDRELGARAVTVPLDFAQGVSKPGE
jgi:ferritin